MKLDEYQKEAEEDVIIDRNKIDRTAAELPTKTIKWLRYLNKEKIKLKSLEQHRDTVRSGLYAYYAGYAEKPYMYSLQKSEIKEFLIGDPDLQEVEQVLEVQKTVVEYITEVINTLNRAGFSIKHFIDWNKFQAGGY
jgi:hypothetical protein